MEKEGEDFMNEGNHDLSKCRSHPLHKSTPSTPWSFEEVRALRWCSNPSNECSSGSKRLRVHWTDTRPCTASCGIQTVLSLRFRGRTYVQQLRDLSTRLPRRDRDCAPSKLPTRNGLPARRCPGPRR